MRLVVRLVRHPLIRNNSFFFLSTASVGLANYLLNTSATRHFAPGDYSQFGVVLGLAVILLPIAGALSSAVVRQASFNRVRNAAGETASVLRALVRTLTLAFVVLLGVTFVARGPIGHFLHLTTIRPVYFVVVSTYWVFLQGLLQALLQEEGKYGRISAVYIGEGIFRGFVGVSVIVAGLGMTVTLAVYMLSAILATFFLPRPSALWTGARASHRTLLPLYRDAVPLLLSNIGFSVLTTLDVVLCRRYLDPIVADHYTAIAQMAKFFLAATGSIGMIAFAEVVKAAHRGESNVRPLGVSLALIGSLGAPFVVFCALFGPPITAFVFGGSFRESGHALWITAASAFSISLLTLEVAYFNARKWLGFLPIFLIGTVATVAALPLARNSLRGYAGTYAIATTVLATLFLLPVFLSLTGRVTIGTADEARSAVDAAREPHIVASE
jgi:O-antigen/teichoic acid export membrane protein